MNYALYVEAITKKYNDITAIDKLSFKTNIGECFSFLGPNGAGKSTLMRMIYGLSFREKEDNSKLLVFGFDAEKNRLNIKSFSGIVPQENNLDEQLTVQENLLLYSKFYGIEKKKAYKRISYLLDFMELSSRIKSSIKELSGGMKRRLIIARALLNEPQLLILDEPTTGLDPQVRHLIWEKLRTLKENGTTILLTTHYMEEAFQISDRVLILDKGKKIAMGSPRRLLSENIEKYVLEYHKSSLPKNIKISKEIIRIERSQGIILLYSNKLNILKALTESMDTGDHYLRHSNLEDLFLMFTGRKLNEAQ